MNATQAKNLVEALEIPDCDCVVIWGKACRCKGACDHPEVILSPPCSHILAREHNLSMGRWAELLNTEQPEEYVEPPADSPIDTVLHQDRVAAYEERARAARRLFNNADFWNKYKDIQAGGISVKEDGSPGRLRNGIPNPNQLLAIDNEYDPEEEVDPWTL